jgi:hypothetical protein
MDYEYENGTETIFIPEEGLKAKIFEKLDCDFVISFGDENYALYPKGIQLIEKIKARIETRIGVKYGYDLFPDEANIPEYKKAPQIVLNEVKNNTIITQNKIYMETTKNETANVMTPAKVEVIKYSERAIALKGEGTKQIKDQLKALGGKFNRYLKSDNGQFAGWIFSVKRQNEVTELLNMRGV